MTRDEMIEKLNGAIENAEAFERDVHLDVAEAKSLLAALRSRPAPPDDLALRHAWEAGFRLCRSYGDNHHHFDGEQKERRWRDYIKGLAAPAPVAAPAPGWPDANNAVQWKPKPECVIGRYCQRHGFIHGSEAEELRERMEALTEWDEPSIRRVLDEVDARDSLAYLEAVDANEDATAAPAPETPEVCGKFTPMDTGRWQEESDYCTSCGHRQAEHPAPETHADLLMNRMGGSGFAPPIRFTIGGTGEARSETPAPDVKPCPVCGSGDWSCGH